MPTYEYVCKTCDSELEAVQSMHEPSLTDCPNCEGGRLRKVFGNVGVVFKGSGFYRNDSRNGRGAGAKSSSSTSNGGTAESDGGTKAEAKPKAKEPVAAGPKKSSDS